MGRIGLAGIACGVGFVDGLGGLVALSGTTDSIIASSPTFGTSVCATVPSTMRAACWSLRRLRCALTGDASIVRMSAIVGTGSHMLIWETIYYIDVLTIYLQSFERRIRGCDEFICRLMIQPSAPRS